MDVVFHNLGIWRIRQRIAAAYCHPDKVAVDGVIVNEGPVVVIAGFPPNTHPEVVGSQHDLGVPAGIFDNYMGIAIKGSYIAGSSADTTKPVIHDNDIYNNEFLGLLLLGCRCRSC